MKLWSNRFLDKMSLSFGFSVICYIYHTALLLVVVVMHLFCIVQISFSSLTVDLHSCHLIIVSLYSLIWDQSCYRRDVGYQSWLPVRRVSLLVDGCSASLMSSRVIISLVFSPSSSWSTHGSNCVLPYILYSMTIHISDRHGGKILFCRRLSMCF